MHSAHVARDIHHIGALWFVPVGFETSATFEIFHSIFNVRGAMLSLQFTCDITVDQAAAPQGDRTSEMRDHASSTGVQR